jgi:hypothetical protein
VVSAISPQLLNTPKAIDILGDRLAGYAVAMIEGEFRRRLPDGMGNEEN